MALVTLDTRTGTRTRIESLYVYMRGAWNGDWVYVPYLRPRTGKRCTIPGRSSMTFEYHYGAIQRPDETAYAVWESLAAQLQPGGGHDWYICVTAQPEGAPGYLLWTGIVPARVFDVFGTQVRTGLGTVLSGNEALTAQGFEYLLERRRISGAYVRTADGSADNIGWAPTFNLRSQLGASMKGNRSGEKIVSGGNPVSYGFGMDEKWSVRDILEYVLYWTSPGATEPTIVLSGPSEGLFYPEYDLLAYLDTLYDVVAQDGQHVWSLINRLLDHRRGICALFDVPICTTGGSVNYGLPEGDVELRVFSMLASSTHVAGVRLPGNRAYSTVQLDTDRAIPAAHVVIDSLQTYDRIRVEGERMVSCFTVATQTQVFALCEKAWTGADETAYKAANDADRKSDRFGRVYRMFKLGDDFTWAYQGEGGAKLAPACNDDGQIQLGTNGATWNAGHRILSWLPLMSPADIAAESKELRPRVPFAVLNLLDDDGNPTGYWILGHDPPSDDDETLPSNAETGNGFPSARLTPHDREGLVEIPFTPNHRLGKNHFDPEDAGTEETTALPVYDYNRMGITLAVETDIRPHVEVLTGAGGYLASRKMTIRVPDAQMWIVAPNTCTGVDGVTGEPTFYTGPQIVRDDTDLLRRVAALAKAIYGRRRATARITWKRIMLGPALGTILHAVVLYQQSQDVLAPVTEVRWDFLAGTTTIETAHLSLDVLQVQ